MLLPALLKETKPRMKVGFFLHTPFPSSEIYRTLPVREELLRSGGCWMLGAACALGSVCMQQHCMWASLRCRCWGALWVLSTLCCAGRRSAAPCSSLQCSTVQRSIAVRPLSSLASCSTCLPCFTLSASALPCLPAVLKADLIGFHTYDYARHFVSACTRILGLEGTPAGEFA